MQQIYILIPLKDIGIRKQNNLKRKPRANANQTETHQKGHKPLKKEPYSNQEKNGN